MFGGGVTGLDTDNVSSLGWLANSAVSSSALSGTSYETLKKRVLNLVTPTEVTGDTLSHSDLTSAPSAADGVAYLYHSGSNLTIANPGGPINLGNQKVVVLTEGNVTISNPIRFNPGGLFVLLAKGGISIDPEVGETSDPTARTTADLEGLYLAQGSVSTGQDAGGNTLRWEGTVIGLSEVNLQREAVAGAEYPAEFFVFRPDILLSLPLSLQNQVRIWSEVAP